MHRILKSIPLLLACGVITFPPTLWILSTYLGHINPILPFVSDLGIVPPEASFFALSMCGGSIFMVLLVLLRYDLNRSYVGQSYFLTVEKNDNEAVAKDEETKNVILKQAKLSLISGLLMSTGFLLVGCFRNNEILLVQSVHHLAALIGFFSVLVDMYLERGTAALLGNHQLARYRRILLSICIFFLVTYNTASIASFVINPAAFDDKELRLQWSRADPGFIPHVISTFLEWLLIFLLSPYLYSFHSMFVRARYLNVPSTTTV